MRKVGISWVAGFFEGEGCVSIAQGRQSGYDAVYYRVDLIVSNTERAVLEPFVALFGGRIDVAHRRGRQRPSWVWKTTGSAHSATVLKLLRPWLIGKRRQADVAIEACDLLRRTGWRRPADQIARLAELKAQMHELNRRGLPLAA